MNRLFTPGLLRMRLTLLGVWAVALIAVLVAPQQQAYAGRTAPPALPAALEVPAGHRPFLNVHAVGTQNYICMPAGAGAAWAFLGPQATVFHKRTQVIAHYLSPNPAEQGAPRATWQHVRDGSSVWAAALANTSDPTYVAPGAIPWLLLQVVGAQGGPAGGHKLAGATFIQRINTAGGVAPTAGCALASEIGKRAFVPYTADYVFYRAAGHE